MSYMDEKDKKIQEQMKSEGTLKQIGIIDTENSPQNAPDYAKTTIKNVINAQIVDSDMSQILEQKYSEGTLKQIGIIDTENSPQNAPDYAKTTIKNVINAQIVDSDMSQILEQKYSEGTLKHIGIIDTENFPQNAPDDETCEILDNLFSKNQLTPRQVKYYVDPMHITDYFDEYNYNGRKFIRYKATIDQSDNITLSNNDTINKDKFYWIEVKPIVKDQIIEKGRRI